MYQNTRKIAVITGDLVNSTELGSDKIKNAFDALKDCAKTQADWYGAPLHFTRNRGDGWQVIIAIPNMALRSALAFRAALRAKGKEFDSYMGIAEGKVVGDIGSDLNAETEEVFIASGRNLTSESEFLSGQRIKYKIDAGAGLILLDKITQGWTPKQAATVLLFLNPNKKITQEEASETLDTTHQNVSKLLRTASFKEIKFMLNHIEDQLND